MKTCKSCQYWVEDHVNKINMGECRKKSPVLSSSPIEDTINRWPKTYDFEYCGEHKEREEIKPKTKLNYHLSDEELEGWSKLTGLNIINTIEDGPK